MIQTKKGHLLPIFLGVACIILALSWTGWRDAFAAVNYGTSGTNFIGCNNENDTGSLTVTLAQGPNIPWNALGMSCDTLLNSFTANCSSSAETQEVKGSMYSTLIRLNCQ